MDEDMKSIFKIDGPGGVPKGALHKLRMKTD